jgi:DNA-binding transcriptional MerR regulator
LSITKQLEIEDIANLIKLSKVDLIHIILTLKCQGITLEGVHKILNKPYDYKQKILKKEDKKVLINFD